MFTYIRKINYYETDRMGITHHSNYVRFMEEARLEFLDSIGCDYRKMENENVISPVVSVDVKFRKSTTYQDTIIIKVCASAFTGIRLDLEYEMINQKDNSLVCKAVSQHCFVNENFKPLNLRKARPDLYQKITASLNK